jgi:hypothetical protein
MSIRHYLTDYLDERIPADAPTLEAWAEWLAGSATAPYRFSPARPGEVFAGHATVELDRIHHTVGDELPSEPHGATYFYLAEDFDSSGSSVASCLLEMDEGDEVEIVCVRDIPRTYRFDVVAGVPILADTDPATAPADPEQVRRSLQPVLL